jgi:hypothetical protein
MPNDTSIDEKHGPGNKQDDSRAPAVLLQVAVDGNARALSTIAALADIHEEDI